jgi:mannose-6-phosphate isomerase-like protein (cupin superfamily)
MSAKVVGPRDGKAGFLGSIGVRFMIDGAEAGERFSLVEHPMSARALAAPLHRHTREDEYSYVLEGRMGALLGDEVLVANPGDLVFKPRNQWHTFWNAGDEPTRILEINGRWASSLSADRCCLSRRALVISSTSRSPRTDSPRLLPRRQPCCPAS